MTSSALLAPFSGTDSALAKEGAAPTVKAQQRLRKRLLAGHLHAGSRLARHKLSLVLQHPRSDP